MFGLHSFLRVKYSAHETSTYYFHACEWGQTQAHHAVEPAGGALVLLLFASEFWR